MLVTEYGIPQWFTYAFCGEFVEALYVIASPLLCEVHLNAGLGIQSDMAGSQYTSVIAMPE
jgi:hypothetical protein